MRDFIRNLFVKPFGKQIVPGLLVLSLALLSGCGGGGGGGGAPTSGNTPAPSNTVTEMMGPTGGTVVLGEVVVEIPQGLFSESTKVTVTKRSVAEAGIPPSSATLSDVYELVIEPITSTGGKPIEKILQQPLVLASGVPTITIPLNPGFDPNVSHRVVVARMGALKFIEDDGTTTMVPDSMINLQGTIDPSRLTVTVTATDAMYLSQGRFGRYQAQFILQDLMQYNEWRKTFSLASLKLVLNSDGSVPEGENREKDEERIGERIPIVLLHGINREESLMGHECVIENDPVDWCYEYKRDVWNAFYKLALQQHSDFFQRFKVFEYIYPSYNSIKENGEELAKALRSHPELSGSNGLIFVAHSMGGLVARYGMNTDALGERVQSLHTLATPHHGSIGASLLHADRPEIKKEICDTLNVLKKGHCETFVLILEKANNKFGSVKGTDGYKSLLWDNFDGGITERWVNVGTLLNNVSNDLNRDFRPACNALPLPPSCDLRVINLQRFNIDDPYTSKIVTYSGGNLGPPEFFTEKDARGLRSLAAAIDIFGGINDSVAPPNYEGIEGGGDGFVERTSSSFSDRNPKETLFYEDVDHEQIFQDSRVISDLINRITAPTLDEVTVVSAPISGAVPGVFTTNGGMFELSVSPLDPAGDLISAGLNLANFSFTPITVADATDPNTLVTSGTAIPTSIEVVQPTAEGLTVVVLFDSSGSMKTTDPSRFRVDAGKQFINQLGLNDQAAIMDFSLTSFFGLTINRISVLQTFTSDHALLNAGIDKVTESGGTPLFDALLEAITLLNGTGANNPLIVVLSDGKDEGSSSSLLDVVNQAEVSNIPIFPISLGSGPKTDIPQLQNLAAQTGGTFASVQDAAGLTALFENMAIATTKGRIVVKAEGIFTPPLGRTGTFIISGSLITTSGGSSIPTPFSFETEITGSSASNDTIATATTLTLPMSPINGTIDPLGDVDFYRFTASAGDRVTIDIDAVVTGSSLDSFLRLFDSSGLEIAFNDDDATGSLDSFIDQVLSPAGDYFIAVSAFSDSSTGAYNLSVVLQ